MAANGGYAVESVETVPSKFECGICMLIMRQPVQTSCGHRFCRECLKAFTDRKDGNTFCPVDREPIDVCQLLDDRAHERETMDIRVRCSNHNTGCEWTGELRYLKEHCSVNCDRQRIPCENENCNVMALRIDLGEHMNNRCLYRKKTCTHCADKYIFAKEEDHFKKCSRLPLPCTNNCDVAAIPRDKMPEHLSECPLTIVPCHFSNIGCSVQFRRNRENEHMEKYMKEHLQLSITEIVSLRAAQQGLTQQIQNLQLSRQANMFVVKIEHYQEKYELAKATGKPIRSEPHVIDRYKMRLKIDLHGYRHYAGTHMSIFLHLMKGEYDDYNQWPFNKPVSFIIDHSEDINRYYKRTLKSHLTNSERLAFFEKPERDFDKGYGFLEYITLEQLNEGGFIKNDTLTLRCELGF